MLASSEWIVFKSERVDPRFLEFVLMSDDFHRQFMTTVGGVGGSLLRAQRNQVGQIEIPLPNLQEQRRIADAIDAVRRSVELESRAISHASQLKTAAMRELFTRGLRDEAQKETDIGPVPVRWAVIKLGELARIGSGSTPNRKTPSYWERGHFPYLTSANMYDRNIMSADQFVTEQALNVCNLPRLKPGTILMAIVGEGKTLGHCAVLEIEATVSRHVGYLIFDESRVQPLFVRHYFEWRYERLRQLAAGNGSTRGALTAALLNHVHVPVPDILEQKEIADVLDTIDRKIDLHKRKQTVLKKLLNMLLNGLITEKIRASDLDLSVLQLLEKREAVAV